MSKAPSPLLGYNNNVRHKNRVFHIQTEDSGVKYGHIITHLFMDGGRILKSVKTSYSEYVGNDKMADIVRDMMKQQHKAMFIALRDGQFDHLLDPGAEVSQQTKALSVEAAKKKLEGTVPAPAASSPVILTPQPMSAPSPASVAKAASPSPPATARKSEPPRFETPTAITRVPEMRPSTPPLPKPNDEEAPRTERGQENALTLDIDALERAAAAAATDSSSPMFKPASELPPPPANLFREKTATGKYRTLPPKPPSDAPKAPPAPAAKPPSTGAPAKGSPKRYGATRPAAIFGQARPQKSIFGEDLISDKSLDEVILSYLADDFEPPKKK